ncbi:AbrB/MazE/SpoVT family DNA-binding domain-containing protein [Thermococcus sp. 2319x1]|uniref:AbrB/MazE/SpoVT family DNA-binding domain-containing protein n=1 Tax=Thermococcus sp. 2319x1 TaxID=1674923 RepID=UPI001E438C6C|nr:AbrB/MazE/SpoVT family DNA-binding domain-containing protein [Thermococcus sp. 2319x1]
MVGKVGITKVDGKGRILLPKEIRKKLRIKKGEEFLVMELDNETIILKRFDVKSMLQELVKKAEKVNLKKLEKEIEDEGNRIAREKYKISD